MNELMEDPSTRELFKAAVARLRNTRNRDTSGDLGTVYWEDRTMWEAYRIVRLYFKLEDPTDADRAEARAALALYEKIQESLRHRAECGNEDAQRALGWPHAGYPVEVTS